MAYTDEGLIEALLGKQFDETDTPSSSEVTEWISEVEEEIDLRTGTSFKVNTVSDEYYDFNGGNLIVLKNQPVVAISSLEYNENGLGQSASWISLTEGYAEDYLLYKDRATIRIHSNTQSIPSGNQNIKISYTWGKETTPKVIQRLATMMVVDRIVENKVNQIRNKAPMDVTLGELEIKSNYSQLQKQKDFYMDKVERLFRHKGSLKVSSDLFRI